MWDGCGLERDGDGLAHALEALDALPLPADAESLGMLEVASLIARAALEREESRGAHFRTDFPGTDPAREHRTCWAGDEPHPLTVKLTEVA